MLGTVLEKAALTFRIQVARHVTPPRLFVLSFLGMVLAGTAGFMVLPGLYADEPLTWTDAFFTATSAVCVTGLIVVDTATYFTTFGQAYVLLLIQLGGLGMITFTSFVLISLGFRLSLTHENLTRSPSTFSPHVDHLQLTRHIFTFTFGIEAIGALLLYAFWVPRFGVSGAIWPAVFHSISAFCNAGFSTFSDSLMSFQEAPLTLLLVMTLIIIGGLGFLVIEELVLLRRSQKRGEPFRMSLHSRIVLITTGVLILGGWGIMTAFEWRITLGALGPIDRLINGLFLSVTPRTAGFNTVDYASTAEATNFLTIILMSIGGSPGSTAGGLKTTGVAILGLLAWSRLRGYQHTLAGTRTIPEATVQRTVGLFVIAFGLVTAGIFFLTATQQEWVATGREMGTFLEYMFEATSAFNTVGLSMGVTGDLSTGGRWITIVLMFIGRVGPLTVAAALALSAQRRVTGYRYAHEDVAIG